MLYTCAKEFDFMEAEVCTSNWLLFILTLDIKSGVTCQPLDCSFSVVAL